MTLMWVTEASFWMEKQKY